MTGVYNQSSRTKRRQCSREIVQSFLNDDNVQAPSFAPSTRIDATCSVV